MPALAKKEETKQESHPTEDLLANPEFKATLKKAKEEISKRKLQITRKYQPWKSNAEAKDQKPKPVRKPRAETNYNGAVYIGHIPHGFYEEQIKSFFSQFGRVKRINVARSQKTGKSKGYAFVEFDHPEVAKVVAETMNNYLLFERLLKAEYIPPEKVHKGMFPEGKSYRDGFCPTIKHRIKQIKLQDELMTTEEVAKNRQRMKKGLKATLSKLKGLGIDYEPQVFDPSAEELGALGLVVKRKRVESEDHDEKEEPQPKKSKKSKKNKTQQKNVETKVASNDGKKAEVKPRPFIAKKVKGAKDKPAEPASTPPEVVEPVVTAQNAFTVGTKDVTAPAQEGKRRKQKKAKAKKVGIKATAIETLPTLNQTTESVEAPKSSPNESSTSAPAAKKKKKNRKPKSNQNGASAKDDEAKTVPESVAATSAQNGPEKKKKRKKSGAKAAAPAPEGN